MKRLALVSTGGLLGTAMLLLASGIAFGQQRTSRDDALRFRPDSATLPASSPDRKVGLFVAVADLVPGLGRLDVDPATLPVGPFLAYDSQGNLLSSIYMIPVDALNGRRSFGALDVAQRGVDHVDILFNAGHPSVPKPHYHVILWYVSARRAADLAK